MSTTTFNSIGNDRVDITSLTVVQAAWQTIDLSAYVPVGATAAIIEFKQTGTSTAGRSGVRHPSSSIETANYQYSTSKLFLLAPLNASRQTSIRRTGASISLLLHGWTGSGVTMLTDRVSLGTHAGSYTWDPVDLSAYCPVGTKAVIIEIYSTYPNAATGIFRHPDSTVGLSPTGAYTRYHSLNLSAVNDDRVVSWGAAAGAGGAYLVGYITADEDEGFFAPVDVVNVTPASGGSETTTDLMSRLPAGADMVFVNLYGAGNNNRIRKDSGYTGDYNYASGYSTCFMAVTTLRSVLLTNAGTTAYYCAYVGGSSQVPYYYLETDAVSDEEYDNVNANATLIPSSVAARAEITQYGFEYGLTEGGPYTEEVLVSGAPAANTFQMNLTDLEYKKWYFIRAKMYHPTLGWIYGHEVAFQTAHDDNLVKFEYTPDLENDQLVVYGNNWYAMTFTPLAGHVLRSVAVRLRKVGAPTGDFTVSIRATSGGLPTGADLVSVTFPLSEMPTSNTEYELGLGDDQALASGTKYAIIYHIVGGNTSNCVYVRRRSSDMYTGGNICASTNAGVSWTGRADDAWFAEYGESGVDTYPPTNVKASTATAEGFLYDPTDITQVGFEWGTSSGVYTDEEVDTSGIYFTGPVQIEISGLTHSTHYYIRAKALHSTFGWLYGREVEFDTLEPYPEVRTDPPSSIGDTDITAVGNILDLVEGDATERGFVYGLSSQSAPGNVAPESSGYDDYVSESGTFGTGSFSLALEDILASKLYYIRAYAKNAYGYGYGDEFMVLTSSVVNFIYPSGTSSQGIRFDTSPGGGWNHPGGGTIPHWQLVRTKFIKSWVSNARWGYFITESSGGYAYEHNYYNDNMYTDLYTFENPRTRSEGILKVKWQATFWRSGYPFGHYQRHLVTHSTQYDGVKSYIGAPTNPTNICEIFYTNPNTGEQWTLDEVDAIVAGASVGESGGFGIAILDFMRIVVCWANADVRTDPAEYINSESSKLVGYVLEDEGEACTVYFEWGETTAYEHGATTSQTKSKGEFFYETLTGLVEGQTYHVRTVIVTGCGETFYGDDRTFPFLSYPGIWLGTGPTDRFLMEITDHVLGYRTEQGRDEELGHAASGIAELTCDNWDGRFSPEKTDGAYYGFLYIGAYLTIIETYGGTLYYRFSGKIDKISPHPEPDNRVGYIVAIDGMDDLAGSEIETVLRTDTDEQELLGDILDAAGWLAGMRDLDAGVDTLQLGWFHEEMALPAVNSLEDATRGFFFVDPEGNATWQNRHYRVIGDRLVSQYTFDENMIEVQYEWSKRDVKNWARVTGYKYVDPYYGLPSEDWLWYAPANSEAAPFIPASSTITIWASLQGPRKSSDALVEGTHWNANSEYDKSGDDLSANITVTPTYYGQAIKFVIENTGSSGAYLVVPDSPPVGAPDDSTLLVYGTIYEELVMTVVEEDTTSQDDYGKRTMSIDARFKSNYNDILAYAEWLIARYKDPLPSPIRIRVNPWYNYPDDALKIYTLTLKISDRVTVVSSHLGISQDYFIDKIIHEYAVNEGSWVETAEYWLSRTEGQSEGLYWILGVAGFTELGQTTRLGF